MRICKNQSLPVRIPVSIISGVQKSLIKNSPCSSAWNFLDLPQFYIHFDCTNLIQNMRREHYHRLYQHKLLLVMRSIFDDFDDTSTWKYYRGKRSNIILIHFAVLFAVDWRISRQSGWSLLSVHVWLHVRSSGFPVNKT